MTSRPTTRFHTIDEVAALLAVSPRSVRRWIADGDLPTHRFRRSVRISDADLRAFVTARRTS